MNKTYLTFIFLIIAYLVNAQVVIKPIGCFAGTNGTNPAVLSHPEARGVLLAEKWSTIEQVPGVYDFTVLDAKINSVKQAGLKYALAIPAGAFGSPNWLIDSLNVSFHTFQYQSQTWRLPLWWDTLVNQKLEELITQLGNRYAADSMLSHVYVSQMTVNGVEGHLNGIDFTQWTLDGYTDQKWIAAAKSTSYAFAEAFPDKPIVFEVHEINNDTIVPATIIRDLSNDPNECGRFGLGMWWISGKTTYQTKLIHFIEHYPGDKYAQVIGRSDQPERFNDSLYTSVFSQAKILDIRYIEPWPFEFQNHTHDSLLHDFNTWADTRFSSVDSCLLSPVYERTSSNKLLLFPNPARDILNIQMDTQFEEFHIEVYNVHGQQVLRAFNTTTLDVNQLPSGIYLVQILGDNRTITKRFIRK